MKNHIKIAITGAAGNIGYALLFRIASGQMFGKNTTIDLNLLDLEPMQPALNGIAMELQDCAFPLLKNINCYADLNKAVDGVNWALLIGAARRQTGMERSDLLRANANIFIQQGKAINEHAAPDIRVLVIGNPCNTNCLIAMHHAPDVPNNRFFAMTALDEKRAINQLALKSNVSTNDIHSMAIWGNHSATLYPDFHNAFIKNMPVSEIIKDHSWLENDFIKIIQQRGAEIIKARGSSSAASAANAIITTVYNLVHDTPTDNIFSVGKCSEGEYNIDNGLIFSFPCKTKNGKTNVIAAFKHDKFAIEKINITLNELRNERDTVKSLKLIL